VKVLSDPEQCIASGACVLMCPEVFGQDADGIVVILQDSPAEHLHRDVQEAVDSCPAACIWTEATEGGEGGQA
jgi:ferredoxin